MSISEITLYNILRKKFGEEETSNLVEFIKADVKDEVETKTSILLTKDDKIDLVDRINKSKLETIIWIVGTGVLQFLLSIIAKKNL
jgi:diacylglycerol kinase family enzyme